MNKAEIDAIIGVWLKQGLDQDCLQRTQLEFAQDFAAHNDMTVGQAGAYLIGSDAEGEVEHWQKAVREHQWDTAENLAGSFMRRHGLDLEKGSDGYALLCMGLTRASCELHSVRADRSLGIWAPEFSNGATSSIKPAEIPQPKAASPDTTLGVLSDKFLREIHRLKLAVRKRLMDYEAALTLFSEFCGRGIQIDSIDQRKIGEFRSLLSKLPPNRTKRFPGKTLQEVIKLTEESRIPTLNSGTINCKYLALISSFFKWCKNDGYIEENPANCVRMTTPRTRIRVLKRGSFKPEHLEKLFRSPLFTGCKNGARIYEPGDHRINDHRRWLPLLALFTGARLNELCQLRSQDVREIDGIWCVDITPDGGKDLKTRAAQRLVPVHPELIKLGLVEYVIACNKSEQPLLWKELSRGSSGYASDSVSKWFRRVLIKSLGAHETAAQKLAFHSFRHTMKDGMRAADVHERIQDRVLGHETDHVSGQYGLGSQPPQLFSELKRVCFDVDLSHLYPDKNPNDCVPKQSVEQI